MIGGVVVNEQVLEEIQESLPKNSRMEKVYASAVRQKLPPLKSHCFYDYNNSTKSTDIHP